MKKSLLTLFITVFFTGAASAQVIGISVEEFYSDNGTITGYPSGHTTYRIYAECTNPGDRVLSVVGYDEAPLALNVPDGIWSHPEPSGVLGSDNSCNLYTLFPALVYDSYVTIGRTCNTDPGGTIFSAEDTDQPWRSSFDTNPYGNGTILLNSTVGGGWSSPPQDGQGNPFVNVVAGTDLKVLIAQITTTGSICGSFNVQCRLQGQSTGAIVYSGLVFGTEDCGTPGCNDDTALNFDPAAGFNDGTCLYDCAIAFESILSENPTCPGGDNGSIDVVVTGYQDVLEIEFNGGSPFVSDGSFSVSNLEEGIYQIVARDRKFYNEVFNPGGMYGTCEAIEFIELFTDPIVYSAIETTNPTCGGDQDGCAIAAFSGGFGSSSFMIYDASSNTPLTETNGEEIVLPSPDYCGLSSGVYFFMGQDENGCTAISEEFSIVSPAPLNIIVGASAPAECFNSPDGVQVLTWSGGTGDVDWSLEDDGVYDLEGGVSTIILEDLIPGEYMAYAQDVNGCQDTQSFTVTGGPEFIVEFTSIAPECPGEINGGLSVVATGGAGGFTYDFECQGALGSQNTWSGLAPGSYDVCIMDETGCFGAFEGQVFDAVPLSVNVISTGISCNGSQDGSIDIIVNGGSGDYQFSIDGEEFSLSSNFSNLEAGSYDVIVVDGNGCTLISTDVALILEPEVLTVELVDAGGDGGFAEGFIDINVAGGSSPYSFQWSNANGPVSADEDPFNLTEGSYSVVVTDANACSITVNNLAIITGVAELANGTSLMVLPNPTNGIFDIRFEGLSGQKVAYSILDAQGRVLLNKELGNITGQIIENIDGSDFASGIYHINVFVGEEFKNMKLIVQ